MIEITFKRDQGRIIMTVNANEFTNYLRNVLGCTVEGGWLANRPYATSAVIDAANERISSKVLLRLDGPHEYNLAETLSNPPTSAFLQKLGESAEDVARAILDHYRPVEIKVRVLPKVPPKVAAEVATSNANPTEGSSAA